MNMMVEERMVRVWRVVTRTARQAGCSQSHLTRVLRKACTLMNMASTAQI